jgi:hypothetical protein
MAHLSGVEFQKQKGRIRLEKFGESEKCMPVQKCSPANTYDPHFVIDLPTRHSSPTITSNFANYSEFHALISRMSNSSECGCSSFVQIMIEVLGMRFSLARSMIHDRQGMTFT